MNSVRYNRPFLNRSPACADRLRRISLAICLSGLALLSACRPSPYVHTTITNVSGDQLQQLQVDYPSASFGKDKFPSGAAFVYRFKIQGSGKPHLEFLDSSGRAHSADGPQLTEGQSGTLDIRIEPAYSVTWAPVLTATQ